MFPHYQFSPSKNFSSILGYFSSSIFYSNFLPKVSGNRDNVRHPITETILKIIIGFILVLEIELNTNWLLILANAPNEEDIPNPIPRKGNGYISVTNKKNTEKYAHMQNLAENTNTVSKIPSLQVSQSTYTSKKLKIMKIIKGIPTKR